MVTKRYTIYNTNNKDKNKGKPSKTIKWLDNIPLEVKREFSKKYDCSVSQVDEKVDGLINYCKAKGKTYKDYKSALQNWLLRDYGLRKRDYLKFKK